MHTFCKGCALREREPAVCKRVEKNRWVCLSLENRAPSARFCTSNRSLYIVVTRAISNSEGCSKRCTLFEQSGDDSLVLQCKRIVGLQAIASTQLSNDAGFRQTAGFESLCLLLSASRPKKLSVCSV